MRQQAKKNKILLQAVSALNAATATNCACCFLLVCLLASFLLYQPKLWFFPKFVESYFAFPVFPKEVDQTKDDPFAASRQFAPPREVMEEKLSKINIEVGVIPASTARRES